MAGQRGPERRFIALRASPAEDGPLEGVLVAYGPTGVAEDMGTHRELMRPGAFGDVSGLDLRANVQHQRARPIGATGGGGLVLADSVQELAVRLDLPDTQDGRDARELVRLGILTGWSVEMHVRRQRFDRLQRLRTIERADLLDLALVDRPGYASARVRRWQPPPERRRVWL